MFLNYHENNTKMYTNLKLQIRLNAATQKESPAKGNKHVC